MKKVTSMILALALLYILPASALAAESGLGISPPGTIHSEVVYLFNMDEDMVIYQRGADQPMYPASLTKIMTAILAIENTPDMREIVTYPAYVQNYLFNYQVRMGYSVSLAGMRAGEEMPMGDLLYGLMLRSGNEIAMTIADHVGGSQEGFVEMMNRRAAELGAANTNFENATGLHHPDMVTTARDMAILTKHAMGLPGFMDVVTTHQYVAGPTNMSTRLEWNTTNAMQIPGSRFFNPAIRGVKTGSTGQAGRCFISTATRDGFTYLLVLMNAPFLHPETGEVLGEIYTFVDAQNIYEWAFRTFQVLPLIGRSMRVHEIPLRLSAGQDFLPLETGEQVTALVPRDIDLEAALTQMFELPDSIDAPIERGEVIGYMRLVLDGREVGRVELLAAETVSASRFLLLLEQITAILGSFWFRFSVIFVLLLIVLYVILMVARNKRRRGGYRPKRRI
ncbi:MAG: D-alanyl-D-alanine carboxypeptidase [Oscillospiraceae bacterium]|nr:D-alanyl-D-alanine carboxypeptidase [Oscillospiraceae bacterium]